MSLLRLPSLPSLIRRLARHLPFKRALVRTLAAFPPLDLWLRKRFGASAHPRSTLHIDEARLPEAASALYQQLLRALATERKR